MTAGYWKHRTRAGTFYIRPHGGRWHACLESESLGSYSTPAQALDDLVGGHTFSPSSGVDTSTLGIPDDLGQWEFHRGTDHG